MVRWLPAIWLGACAPPAPEPEVTRAELGEKLACPTGVNITCPAGCYRSSTTSTISGLNVVCSPIQGADLTVCEFQVSCPTSYHPTQTVFNPACASSGNPLVFNNAVHCVTDAQAGNAYATCASACLAGYHISEFPHATCDDFGPHHNLACARDGAQTGSFISCGTAAACPAEDTRQVVFATQCCLPEFPCTQVSNAVQCAPIPPHNDPATLNAPATVIVPADAPFANFLLSWTAPGFAVVDGFGSLDGGAPFSMGPLAAPGSTSLGAISQGQTLQFWIYAPSDHVHPLATTVVTAPLFTASASPNPVLVPAGASFANFLLSWNTPGFPTVDGYASLDDGALFNIGAGLASPGSTGLGAIAAGQKLQFWFYAPGDTTTPLATTIVTAHH